MQYISFKLNRMSRIKTYEDVLSLKYGDYITLDSKNNNWLQQLQLYDWPTLTYYQFEVRSDFEKNGDFDSLELTLRSRTHTLPEIKVPARMVMEGNWHKG